MPPEDLPLTRRIKIDGPSGDPKNIVFLDWRDRQLPHDTRDFFGRAAQEADRRQLAPHDGPGIRFIVIVTELVSAQLCADLARSGLWISSMDKAESLERISARFVVELQEIARRIADFKAALIGHNPAGRRAVSDAERQAYANNPPGFDQLAFRYYLWRLTQPWSPEDDWRSET
jgi:hypothetical protein